MKESTGLDTSYVCHCARVTVSDFDKILHEADSPTYAQLKEKFGIGGQCTSCEYEVKGLLDERLSEIALQKKEAKAAEKKTKPASKVRKQSFIEKIRTRFVGEREPEKVEELPKPVLKPLAEVRETYRTGVFFLRKDGLESHLVVANVQFPEHEKNPNGDAVNFHVTLFGEDGNQLARSREMSLPNNQSIECTPSELFPDVQGDVVGAMYPDFDNVAQTGSLRPYGLLVNTDDRVGARCHYHDKFALFTDPGFFQNTSPFEPGQTCWMAISNCQPKPYESDYNLLCDEKKWSGTLRVEPMASRWVKLADLFPGLDASTPELSPGLFWLDNPQHVMVYFFWHIPASGVWMGQHH